MKKVFLFLIICLLYTKVYSIPNDWEKRIVFKENGFTYAVGISDWRETTRRSIYDAYLNAMKNYNIFHNTTIDTEYAELFENGKFKKSDETLRQKSKNEIKKAKIVQQKIEREPISSLVRVKLLIQFVDEETFKKYFQPISLYVPLPYTLDRCLYADQKINTQFGILSQGTHLFRMKNIIDTEGEYIHSIPFDTFLSNCQYKILMIDGEHYGPYVYDEFHTPDGLHDDELVLSKGIPREKY